MSLNKFTDTTYKSWMDIGCNKIVAKEVDCDILKFGKTIPSFPVQTYYTDHVAQITNVSPETNILVDGIGSVSYTGDDVKSSKTIISTQMIGQYYTGDVYVWKLYRGGKLLYDFTYQNISGASANDRTDVKWTITTQTAGVSGQLLVEIQIQRGNSANGIAIEEPRYSFIQLADDTEVSGDLQFTIEPTAVNALASLDVLQSTVYRS